jgi:hypothetical protein
MKLPLRRRAKILSAVSAALVVLLLAGLAIAQRPLRPQKQRPGGPRLYEAPENDTDLSGRVTFARIKYEMSGLGRFGMHLGDGGLPWSHDYPDAGKHLMKIISELSKTDVTLDHNEPIFSFDDPELFKYPIVYLAEAGFMEMSDKEIAGWREYCLRGGFVIVDDFRGDYEFSNFRAHFQRAFPDLQLKELDLSHPVFNCFFSIKTLDVPPMYGGGYGSYETLRPKFYGLEDAQGRLMMIVNYNYDVSDFWQWSDNPFAPIEETNEAYKFGVNYVMYALTH